MRRRALHVLLLLCALTSRGLAQDIEYGFQLLDFDCGITFPLEPGESIEVVGFTTVTVSAEGASSLSQSVVISSPHGADFALEDTAPFVTVLRQ